MRYIMCLILLLLVFCTQAQKKETPIPWKDINPTDILWKKRVWRQIDLREKNNAPLSNDSLIPKENIYANVILYGLKNATIKAYADEDTAFQYPLSIQKIDSIIQCGQGCSYPRQVAYYQMIEDWIFDRNKGVMVVHILAIAPAANVNGNIKPLFWLRYADNREYFAQPDVYNGNKKMDMLWDEYFESRQFSSMITKVGGPPTDSQFKKHVERMENIQERNPVENDHKQKKHKKKRKKESDLFGDRDIWAY